MQTKQTEPLLKDEEKDQHTPLSNQPLVSLLTRPLPLTSREINGIFFAFFLPPFLLGAVNLLLQVYYHQLPIILAFLTRKLPPEHSFMLLRLRGRACPLQH